MTLLIITNEAWKEISQIVTTIVGLLSLIVTSMVALRQVKMSKQIDGQRTELLKAVAAAGMSKNVVETIKADPDISLTNKE